MNEPSVSFKAINWIKLKSTKCVILVLVIIYFLISILFGVGYFILAENLDNSRAKPIYLGRHDYVITFGKGRLDRNIYEADIILSELRDARDYQVSVKKNNSRFRITITISGSNELQNIAEIKKYYATDFVKGLGFVAIKYEEKDTDKLGIKYKK